MRVWDGYGRPCMGAWGFNSYYGMMTYIPCSGSLVGPYGYRYWSPFTVMQAYYVPKYGWRSRVWPRLRWRRQGSWRIQHGGSDFVRLLGVMASGSS